MSDLNLTRSPEDRLFRPLAHYPDALALAYVHQVISAADHQRLLAAYYAAQQPPTRRRTHGMTKIKASRIRRHWCKWHPRWINL